MNFFFDLEQHGNNTAVITQQGATISYTELAARCDQRQLAWDKTHSLIFLSCENRIETLISYLAALRTGHTVMLLDARLDKSKYQQLLTAYQPNICVDSQGNSNRYSEQTHKIAADVALLLSSSGSTGSPKQIMLSVDNLNNNAQAIVSYLELDSREKAITTLPFSYSYGLSVIHSHLSCGATLLLTDGSLVSRDFWNFFKQQEASSFAGVPYSYQILKGMRFATMQLPSLNYITQAGGKLAPDLVTYFADYCQHQHKKFYLMYGQTEASARMAYLAPDLVAQHPNSIGQPIPGGQFQLATDGELLYQGKNVMLGYAQNQYDLAKPERPTILRTGDLAYQDKQGLYYISGRKKRFIKITGLRVNLDEIENIMHEDGLDIRCTGVDEQLRVCHQTNQDEQLIQAQIAQTFQLYPDHIKVKKVADWPMTDNDKTDYEKLAGLFDTDH